MPENLQCCGSAGSYMLKHPKMAHALLSDLLETALQTRPDYPVSSNIGCVLHIAAGLRERGIKMEVIHPIVLIARQLKV
jgi:glycolate oxidase iron-sulfur subunit